MKTTKPYKVAIVLPAYNEAGVIGRVLDDLPGETKINGQAYLIDVIVVNDCSTDDTQQFVARRKKVKLINHLVNSGAGAATRTGLAYAKASGYNFVITMDADGQHHTDDSLKVLKEVALGKADLVIGSRLIESQGMPTHRIFGNKMLSLITFFMFGIFVSDSQSGLKGLNAKALNAIKWQSNQYAFCSEMLWRAKRAGLTIHEIPIRAIYTDYSLTKGQKNSDAIHILRHLLKQRLMDFING